MNDFDKKRNTNTTIVLIVFALMLIMGGYYLFGPSGVLGGTLFKASANDIKVDKKITIEIDERKPINATPSSNISKYVSDDEKIVSVSNDGVITGKKEGKTKVKIYNKDNNYIEVEVNVIKKTIKATNISLNKNELNLKVGDIYYLKALIEPENSTEIDVTWESSDLKIATVKSGKVEAVSTGRTLISAYNVNNVMDTCIVNVTE